MVRQLHQIRSVCFLTIFFLLPSLYTIAQGYRFIFRHLTEENGLLSNSVGSVYQDSRGYIWLSTLNGLQRYDGTRFLNYEMNMKDTSALHNSIVTTVFEDHTGRFWVGTSAGIYLMNRNTGKFCNYNLHLPKEKQPIAGANGIMEDGNGDIWFINPDGYFKLNDKTNQFDNENGFNGLLEGSRPGLIGRDEKGNIWFTTNTGVKCYDYVSRKIRDKTNNPDKRIIFDITQKITSFLLQGNYCWYGFAGERKIYRYDFLSDKITAYSIPEPSEKGFQSLNKYYGIRVTYLASGPDNMVIAGLAGEGIAVYEPEKNNFSPIVINNDDPNGLHAEKTNFSGSAPFTDREKNIWLPTGQGINIFNPKKTPFKYYEHSEQVPEYETSFIIQNPADSGIYLSFYNAKGGIIRLSKDLQFRKQFLFTDKPNEAGKNQVWCMYLDDNGMIWAPNQAKTVLKLNTRTNVLTESADSLINDYTSFIQKDHRGNLWIGTWSSGLKKFDPVTKTVSVFINPPPGSSVIPKNIYSVFFEGDSIAWVGTNGAGLLQLDLRQNKYTRQFLFSDQDPDGISSNRIFRIIQYHSDTLLLATPMGINVYDKKKNTFSVITTHDGLPNNIVESIVLDPDDQLWVACLGGFCKISMSTWKVTKFGTDDGIINNNFSNTPFFKIADGRYLVGGAKGFLAFNPSDISASVPPPAPTITAFKVFDNILNADSLISAKAPITLSYKENSITIEFSSLLFNVADKLKYYYCLDGVDKNWMTAGADQAARYNHLQSGRYTFRVKCLNRDGLASVSETAFKIYIRPPYWKTWWFITLVFLVVAGLLYLFYRYRLKSREKIFVLQSKSGKLEKEKAQIEYENLKQQLNPHFLFNSLSSVAGLIETDRHLAQEYIFGLTQIYRYVLQSKEQSLVTLKDELEFAATYVRMQQIRFGDGLKIDINVSEAAKNKKIVPVTLQNLIENAIKHNIIDEESPLTISVYSQEAILTVKNNLQIKNFVETSNKQGLKNLYSLYQYLSDKPVEILKDDNYFMVKIPLL